MQGKDKAELLFAGFLVGMGVGLSIAPQAHADQIAPAGYCTYQNPVPPPGGMCTQMGMVIGRFAYATEFQPNLHTAKP